MASFPIRAPLTVDGDSTDFESQSESGFSENSSNVDNGSEFEDYASGEEFETASERQFAEEETRVKYRPFVVDPDEESLGNSVVDEEEIGADDGFGSGGPNSLPGMPIAQLSIEEDEFDELISDEEDDSLRAIARVDSAPRVRDFEVEDDDKDDEFLLAGDELEVDDSVFDGTVPVSGLGGSGEAVVERKEGVLGGNSGGLQHVFDDSVSVNVVKPRVFIESLVEKRQNLEDLGLESDELIGGDGLDSKSMEIDVEKEEIGETVDVFVDAPESELTEVHNIMAELQDLKVGISNNDCVDEMVSEPEMDEATSFDLEKDADFESTEDKTARQIGMIDESVAFADVIDVDLIENVQLIESSKVEAKLDPEKTALQRSSLSDAEIENMIFGGSEAELGESSSPSIAGDVDFVPDSGSGPEIEMNKEHGGKDLLDPVALNALLKVASGFELDRDRITLTTEDGRVFSIQRPGSSFNTIGESKSIPLNSVKEDKELIEKIRQLRVKFLRAVYRLGLSPEDPIVDHVLKRLAPAAGGHVSEDSGLDSAERTSDEDDLDFSLNILVIGKTGVGKSATINSIFGEKKVEIDAFERSTTTVKEIVGMVNGVRIRVLDTPGLRLKDGAANRKTLASVKRSIKKFPPDVVLYVDRLDEFTGDFSDFPLLDLVTRSLSSSIWRNVIVTLTHANAVLPDGPYGSPMSFQTFVARRSHVVQQAICRAAGEIRLVHSSAMHPVAFVENHPLCPKNEKGERMLSIGQCWRPQLLLLCYSLKILSEAKSVTGPQDSNVKKWIGLQSRSLPVPHLLSSLLQSRPHLKPQSGDDVDSDLELLDFSDEDEDEYDQLPPFKPLKRSAVDKLSKEQRRAYLEEYDYRVNLLLKKQLKEEVKKLKDLKKKPIDKPENSNQEEEEGPATVPVSMPDFSLPLSFDSDHPSYRYRALEPTWQLLIRPVLDPQGWDHDLGYDGINIEQNLTIRDEFPSSITLQITKDKKEFNVHLDSSVCAKHGENRSTMAGFDIQNLGRQLAYILRTETQFKNFKLNKTSGGLCLTLAGENAALGLKIEDQIALGKQIALTGSAGAVRSKGETALGANFEVRLKSRDYPLKQDQSTLGLSVIQWRGDLGVMANLQSQFSVGRNSRVAIGVGMNNKRSGQISIKNSSCELQIAAIGVLPVVASVVRSLVSGSAAKDSNLID